MKNQPTPPLERPDFTKIHRRETRVYVILPMIVTSVIFLAAVAVVLLFPQQAQVALVADWMGMIFLLCPSILCLFLVCVILFALVGAMSSAQRASSHSLNKAADFVQHFTGQITGINQDISRRASDLGVRWAFFDRLLGIFDPPEPPDAEKSSEEASK